MANYNTSTIHACKQTTTAFRIGLPKHFMDILGWPSAIYFDETNRQIRPAGKLECGKRVRPIMSSTNKQQPDWEPSYFFHYAPLHNELDFFIGAWNPTVEGDVITLTEKLN